MSGISRVIVTCNSANPLVVEAILKNVNVADTSQITEEVQMPLSVSSQAEDGERKVQNICDDNRDVYLQTATKDSLFVRAKEKEGYVTDVEVVGSVYINITFSENLLGFFV
jgi:hypothetical protein